MKRFLLPLLCLSLLFAACTKTTTDDDSPESGQPVIATFVYAVNQLVDFSNKTRSDGSVDEDIAEDTTIHDINLYVWPTNDPSAIIHKYQDTGAGISLPLAPGTYQVRVVANIGYDMDEFDVDLLEYLGPNFYLTEEEQRRTVLFSATKEVTLTGAERQFNVELQRLFARTYVNVRVADAVQGYISLVSAQVCNIPKSIGFFSNPEGGSPNSEFCVSTVMQPANNQITDLVYTYENLQPSNPAITAQNQRGGNNVPEGATYVHIIAHTPEGFFNYMIYLGENNTSNFTIRRNTSTRYDITIEGINTVDLRVTSTMFIQLTGYNQRFDLVTWPTSASTAVFDYGKFAPYEVFPFLEGRSFVQVFADQYNFDNGSTWTTSDNTSLLPLLGRYDYAIYLRDFAKSIPHPDFVNRKLYDFYYGDKDSPTLGIDFTSDSQKYGYYVNFKLEGISYSDFDLTDLSSSAMSVLDATKKTYTDNGTFSIFAYPDAARADTPHFNLSFRWPSQYRFLGFYNKDGVQFNPTTTPIGDADVSWSTNGKGTTTAFWREANKGSGDIFLRFEKKPIPLDVQMDQTNKNSTLKLNRNKITLTAGSQTAPVNVQIACNEGDGIFLRNARLNTATGLYTGTAVTTYDEFCSFTTGAATMQPIVFVPYKSGAVSYTIQGYDAVTGALLNELAVTNTIAKSTMDAAFDFAIPKESIKDRYLEYGLPDGSLNDWRMQYGISPYKLYAYAVVQKGGGLEYWPSGLNILFDTTIEYITTSNGADIDQVLIVKKNPAMITTIQRTCQLNICRDITFAVAEGYETWPPIAQEQALLDQYATLLFPRADDPRDVKDIGTPDVYAPNEAIRYDGSFHPYALYWRCKSNTSAVMNLQVAVPKNIRSTGAEVAVNLTRYGADPLLASVTWWMSNYDSLPKE